MFQEVQLVVFGALAFSVDDFSLFVRQAHFHFGTFYLGRLSTLGVLGIVQFHIEVEVGVLILVVEVGHYFKVAQDVYKRQGMVDAGRLPNWYLHPHPSA